MRTTMTVSHLRRGFAALALDALLLAAPGPAAAQAWPAKPVHIIVGYSPGGAVDIIARALGQ